MRVTSKQPLQRLVYADLKAMGLSAQPAIHVARKVSGAYATLKANIRAGNLGDPGAKRRVKAESSPITFRAEAAQPYDDRCLSWQLDQRTVSIWMCSACGHISKKNRPGQATFCCTSCGFAEHADVNAARNIATRDAADWAVSHAADDAAPARHPGAPVTRKLSPSGPRS